HVPGDVHLATFGSPGSTGVAHTIRHADGNWDGFGYLSTSHSQRQLVSAIVDGEEHLLYEDYSGLPYRPYLHHRIRHADGTWTEVTGPGDSTGSTEDLAVAAVGAELHRVRRGNADGLLRHNARHADGTWTDSVVVPASTTSTTDVAITGVGDTLRLVVDDTGGGRALPSFTRTADGTWTQVADVPFSPAPAAVTATNVELAQVGTELHAVVTGSDGAVYHAVQRSTGQWTAFHDVTSETGAPGSAAVGVAITASRGTLHLAVFTEAGRLLHAIRFADGRWQPFGDVRAATGSPSSLAVGAVTLAGS
ncbi:MAG: hypothetical protein HOV94_39180, partial [Saccharothrix sp.]|nr:hypothetical protein [Saccharothrix sp.]